jgi:hypothetical protein
MPKEISLVDFDFHALTTWGKKEIVVKIPAANPMSIVMSIFVYETFTCLLETKPKESDFIMRLYMIQNRDGRKKGQPGFIVQGD